MVFLSICKALYDYIPRAEGELAISEGDFVYILEKSNEDDWWKGKKKAQSSEEEEPIGLIPNNYVEEAIPTSRAKALYDYARQTDEEISFSEDDTLMVFDNSDPDWTLVGLNGEFGFAPANYIELTTVDHDEIPTPAVASPALPSRPRQEEHPEYEAVSPSAANPAANLANILSQQTGMASGPSRRATADAPEEDIPSPSLPMRPVSQEAPQLPASVPVSRSPEPAGIVASPPRNRIVREYDETTPSSPGGYHLYNVNEMVSVMGKQKKMPTTLGINLATGVILIIPEKKRDGPQQEWTAEKLMHYSIEGKHIFMELVKPSKSIDFHAGAKDTAAEIVASLGELAGAVRAEGLREVIAAGTSGQKHGRMLWDFMAQGDDEVTVAVGDEVVILDDSQSEEWWKVRRIKSGKEGVVPSSYVEAIIAGSPAMQSPTTPSLNSGLSTVEQNRLEEQRLARQSINEANRAAKRQDEQELARSREVGPGLKLPNRASSLITNQNDDSAAQRGKRDSRAETRSQGAKSKPDSSKVRTWTDRSGSFKVDAQFIGLKDGKIHLHKVNGVKIAVPVVKMATADLEYVERVTGRSLDEDKPLSDLVKRNSKTPSARPSSPTKSGSAHPPSGPEYDWFDFFLKCGVSPYQCERYSHNFNKDSMDESVLPEITAGVLRNLGLKEGDVLRVMKYLDDKYGRGAGKQKGRNVSFGGEEVIGNGEGNDNTAASGSLFVGPGGALKNNTRKGRPAPTVQTNDKVDARALHQLDSGDEPKPPPKDRSKSPDTPGPAPPRKDNSGFDDSAWDVRPSKLDNVTSTTPSNSQPSLPSPPPLTGSMQDLSLLSQPLQPTVVHNNISNQKSNETPQSESTMQNPSQSSTQQTSQPQPNAPLLGATPQFFNQLSAQPTSTFQPQQAQNNSQFQPSLASQPTGQVQGYSGARQRPQAPPLMQQGSLMPPPPLRPTSAPQNGTNQNNFGPAPLHPQLTGMNNMASIPHSSQSPPPQNLADMNNMRILQLGQQPQLPTGYPQFDSNGNQINVLSNHTTGFNQNQQLQPQATGIPTMHQGMLSPGSVGGSNFGQLQPQLTSYQPSLNNFANGSMGMNVTQPNTVNTFSASPLNPQQTSGNGMFMNGTGQAMQPQLTAINQPPMPPMLPMPQQPTMAPLQPQKTGPAPPVRFGMVPDSKKLMAQPTGRKANLAQATPENPFGF